MTSFDDRIFRFGQRSSPTTLVPGLLLLITACASGADGHRSGAYAAEEGHRSDEICQVEEISRTRLRAPDGRQFYAEAQAFTANSRGEVLLAGVPNFLTRIGPDGEVVSSTRDSVFGAVIRPDGSASLIPSPIPPHLLSGIRAVVRDDDRWDVMFARLEPYEGESLPNRAVSLWYGIYDGHQWEELNEVLLPPGVLKPVLAPRLLRSGDLLAWGMTLRTPEGRIVAVILEKRGGVWSYSIFRDSGARFELGYSESRGLVVAMVGHSDLTPGSANSIVLWERDPGWRPFRVVVDGADGPAHTPWFQLSPAGARLSWHADGGALGREARTIIVAPDALDARVVTLDPSVAMRQHALAPALLDDGAAVWGLMHVTDDRSEFRFVEVHDGRARLLARMPNPYFYMDFTAITATGGSDMLVTGTHPEPNGYFVSLLIRARRTCT